MVLNFRQLSILILSLLSISSCTSTIDGRYVNKSFSQNKNNQPQLSTLLDLGEFPAIVEFSEGEQVTFMRYNVISGILKRAFENQEVENVINDLFHEKNLERETFIYYKDGEKYILEGNQKTYFKKVSDGLLLVIEGKSQFFIRTD